MKIRTAFKNLTKDENDQEVQIPENEQMRFERIYTPIKKKKKKKSIKHGSYFRKRMTDYDQMLQEAYEE